METRLPYRERLWPSSSGLEEGTKEGPAAGQLWGRGWCWLWPLEWGFPSTPPRALGSGQASHSLCHSPCIEHGPGCWT